MTLVAFMFQVLKCGGKTYYLEIGATKHNKHYTSGGVMKTEKITFNVPEDVLASLKVGVKGLELDMRR
ncbi:hypothetical protein MNBD_NITROSPIRAE03-574, partial [hydrothermal vent metagenome]